MKTIYIDMDGVLADFYKRLFAERPEAKELIFGSPDRIAIVREWLESYKGKGLFTELEPIKDAIASFKLLCEHYTVWILTTPTTVLLDSYVDKIIWVKLFLGEEHMHKVNLSHDKSLFIGDYIIDDTLNSNVGNFKGIHIFFGKGKFKTWKKVIKFLRKIDNW